MAWTAVNGSQGSFISAALGTGQATISAPAAAANDLLVLALATDNRALVDGESASHEYVWDDAANVYAKCREHTIAGGAAGAGVTISLWTAELAAALTGKFITFSFGNVVAGAWAYEYFSKAATSIDLLSVGARVDAGADPGALTLGSLAAAEHLFLRATGHEGPSTDAYTATASHTARSTGTNAGGAAADDISVALEWRILNATTDTTDPAWAGSRDHASVMAAVDESATAPAAYAGANDPVVTFEIEIEGPLGRTATQI